MLHPVLTPANSRHLEPVLLARSPLIFLSRIPSVASELQIGHVPPQACPKWSAAPPSLRTVPMSHGRASKLLSAISIQQPLERRTVWVKLRSEIKASFLLINMTSLRAVPSRNL